MYSRVVLPASFSWKVLPGAYRSWLVKVHEWL